MYGERCWVIEVEGRVGSRPLTSDPGTVCDASKQSLEPHAIATLGLSEEKSTGPVAELDLGYSNASRNGRPCPENDSQTRAGQWY
jgi:hypothetical protein